MRRNARKWNAIQKALAMAEGVKTVVDLPCGTGRFTGHLARAGYQVVGSDISIEMMHQAAKLLVSMTTSRAMCVPMRRPCRSGPSPPTA